MKKRLARIFKEKIKQSATRQMTSVSAVRIPQASPLFPWSLAVRNAPAAADMNRAEIANAGAKRSGSASASAGMQRSASRIMPRTSEKAVPISTAARNPVSFFCNLL